MGPTLGEYRKKVSLLLRETIDDDTLNEAINDAAESWWETLVLLKLQDLFGGPVSNLSFASGDERQTLVKIADPIVAPTTAAVAGGTFAAPRNISATYTLVTDSGGETKESPVTLQVVGAGNLFRMTAPAFVDGAVGYNVYAGDVAGRRALQNKDVQPFAFDWTEPDVGIIDNPVLPSPPTDNTTLDDLLYIEHMELKTTDGIYKPWDQVQLDSHLMRRAAAAISTSSQYQTYFYSVINHNQVELRPPAGAALAPRYFYVKGFKRIRNTAARFAFAIEPAQNFIKYFAAGLVKLSFEEEIGMKWMQLAESERTKKALGLNRASSRMNRTITAFKPR